MILSITEMMKDTIVSVIIIMRIMMIMVMIIMIMRMRMLRASMKMLMACTELVSASIGICVVASSPFHLHQLIIIIILRWMYIIDEKNHYYDNAEDF